MALAGANSYSGTTTVAAGTLALGADDVLAAAGTVVVAGGTLDVGTHRDTVAGVSLQSGSIAGSTGVLTSASAFDVRSGSVGGVLGGSAGLTKSTAGTVTLSGANTYTGATTVAAGTLALDGSDRLAPTGTLAVAAGATLALNGNQTTTALALAGELGGSGLLTAGSAALDGGVVRADAAATR